MSSSEDDFYGGNANKLEALKHQQPVDLDLLDDISFSNSVNTSGLSEFTTKYNVRKNYPDIVMPKLEDLIKMRSNGAPQNIEVENITRQSTRISKKPEAPSLMSPVKAKQGGRGRGRGRGRERGRGRGRRQVNAISNTESTSLMPPITIPHITDSVEILTSPIVTVSQRPPRRGRGRQIRNTRNQQAISSVIDICSSDDEDIHIEIFKKKKKVDNDSDDDIIFDPVEDINHNISLKVCWRSKDFHKFTIRTHQKMDSIFETFSKMEGVPVDFLLLTLGERVLRPQDTPHSINYRVSQFIEGGVIPHSVTQIAEESAKKFSSDDNTISKSRIIVQLQSKSMRNRYSVYINKEEKLSYALMRFSEEFKINISTLKLYFDGDPVGANDTPESLELEGGEVLDVLYTD